MSEHRLRQWDILNGDCRHALSLLVDENSVDSIVTDPPYELGFMGKVWDKTGVANDPATWREALRVLKPGGHLLAFSGTRTYHRIVCAIEDAGFEIRDQLAWVYGSGFPKSHNGEWGGTAMKPAWEPIVLARKPLIGTVEANWREHGTGALNIEGCRVAGYCPVCGHAWSHHQNLVACDALVGRHLGSERFEGATIRCLCEAMAPAESGRWPANLIHDGSDEVMATFPDAPGQLANVKYGSNSKTAQVYGAMKRGDEPSANSNNEGAVGFKMKPGARRLDGGSAARFFYCAKTSKKDREEGLEAFAAIARPNGNKWTDQDYRVTSGDRPATAESGPRKNTHPTVKPTDLMRYLCRLVTPAGGLVLDPFTGSGSTGKAAVLEGFRFLGCELSDEYTRIANARIAAAAASLMKVAA